MSNQPANRNRTDDSMLFSANWHIKPPGYRGSSMLVLGSSLHGPEVGCRLGANASLEMDSLPYPIPGHHFLSYMLSLMASSMDTAEMHAEKVEYPGHLVKLPHDFAPMYFPGAHPQL